VSPETCARYIARVPPRRLSPDEPRTVSFSVDGEPVRARAGEPIAVALAASGRLVLGRSVKYHRPRGAVCYAGRCDGCLMRVDGIGNVMTCRAVARDGMIVETQNVVGYADRDLLAATDWFFPQGLDHHEMFTRFKPINRVMQKVARRIAGIAELPTRLVMPTPPRSESAEIVVAGAGPAGLAAAAECARAGLDVLVVDDAPTPGGQLAIFPGEVELEGSRLVAGRALAEELTRTATESGARILPAHAVVGVYGGLVVLQGHKGIVLVRPKHVVAATGAHEGAAAFEGADLPGVMGVRAACALLAWGVLPGARVAIVGAGIWIDALARAIRAHGAELIGPFAYGEVTRARGRPAVRSIDVMRDGRTLRLACDAVAVSPPESSAFEIAAQAGARVVWHEGHARFDVEADDTGRTAAAALHAVGSCTGIKTLAAAIAQGRAAGHAIAETVRHG